MSADLRRLIKARIANVQRYGVDDAYNTGFIDALAWVLHRLDEPDDTGKEDKE